MTTSELPSKFVLTHEDFEDCARKLGCSVDAIKAVSIVETSGGAFNPDGYPKTLFEGHYFSRFTDHMYDEDYPTISYPKWTRQFYGKGWRAEHARLELAMTLDEEAALRSASWGMFQIMGNNFELCGYETVQDFVSAMNEDVDNHLEAFAQYVINRHLEDELQNLDFEAFARQYNGPGQVEVYHKKMDDAYNKIKDAPDADPEDAVNET